MQIMILKVNIRPMLTINVSDFLKLKQNKIKIINFEIKNITINNFLKKVLYWAKKKKSHYICVSSVHGCIESFRSKKFKIAHNSADIAVADGRPIFWALKLLGSKDADHLPGYYITEEISNLANKEAQSIGFYGSTKKNLNGIKNILKKNIKI